MIGRYLVIAGERRSGWEALLVRLAGRSRLEIVHNHFPLGVMRAGSCRWLSLGEDGGILGTLFPRHGASRPVEALEPGDARQIVDSKGEHLLRAFWGGYVAAIASSGRTRLLRDPSGALPCYYACCDGFTAYASGADLLTECALVSPAIDWAGLARHLLAAGLPSSGTVLEGVRELLPGFAMRPGIGSRQDMAWNPWDHAGSGGDDESVLAERVASAVRQSVHGWTGLFDKVLLGVSGGLDSSIVGACLDGAAAPVCVTMFTQDPAGDEREPARALCRALGLELVEHEYRLEDVDLGRAYAPHLPRPIGRIQAQAYDRVLAAVAEAERAEAFVTGNGGDNVFAYSQSAAAIADRWLAQGFGRPLLRTIADTCRQTGCGPGEAVGAAARILRRGRDYAWRADIRLLSRDALAELARMSLDHPWLAAPEGALPGKSAHVASLLRAQHMLEPGRSRLAPVLHPLLSQPVIEACLKVPSWTWRKGGIDRSLARRAFAAALPREIVERRVKGSPDPFSAALLRAERAAIRERLLGGRMAACKLLDVDAISLALDAGAMPAAQDVVRILQLVAVEAWLDHWLGSAG